VIWKQRQKSASLANQPLRKASAYVRFRRDDTARRAKSAGRGGRSDREPVISHALAAAQTISIQAELLADTARQSVFNFRVSRHGCDASVHGVDVKIVICAMAFQIATTFSKSSQELIRSSANSLPLPRGCPVYVACPSRSILGASQRDSNLVFFFGRKCTFARVFDD
jgi:hypothetical protein